MKDRILIRYGELALKKTNRKQFLSRISLNMRRALKEFPKLEFKSCGMRYYIVLNGEDATKVCDVLKKIAGIHSFSVVERCASTLEEIQVLAKELLIEEINNGANTFKVETNRGDKDFPLTSLEISQKVSSYLFKNIPNLKADVHNPDVRINIDLRSEGSFLYTTIIPGLGGMPAGSMGKVALMVSGGIDSVVAGYLCLKRGITIEAVHFASPPYTSDMAVQKVIDLLEKLIPYTEHQDINLHIVPFTNIQKAIYDNVREDYGITIMRRMMYRITEQLALKNKCLAIANGENVGQVASQTLESMDTIGSVTDMNIIRPLACVDKNDIIKIAEEIDTYNISIRPYEDCCTIFVPKHPQIKPHRTNAEAEENKINYLPLIEEAVNNTQRIVLKKGSHLDLFSQNDEIF